MSFIQPTVFSKSNSNFDELRWVIQIRRTLEEELDDDGEVPVCIFNAPKILMASDPHSYTPHQVAIGPYHYWRPELYDMERYKLAAAKRTQKQLQGLKFQNLVEQLTKLEQRTRACYHKYLDFNGETLAWMMAIDASFLLEFLQVYAVREGKSLSRLSSRMSHLVDYAGRQSAHNAILRDLVMLENQIPLFILRKMLEFQFSSLEAADDMLFSMLMGFCEELSPFKMVEDLPKLLVSECTHLLDFLYDMVSPKLEEPSEVIEVVDQDEDTNGKESSSGESNYVKQFLHEVWKLLSKLNHGPIRLIKKVLLSMIFKLPRTILSNFPGFKILKQPVENFFLNQNETKPGDGNSSSDNIISRPPLVEEITIPSVTELSKSGVHFVPTNGSISTISFDVKTVTFYLPTISLDLNSEAILKNLVAYEAATASGPLVFARFTELMNGIIDTEDDVKLLRQKGIILNHLKSDGDVANLWNGMTKSIRLTKVSYLDKVIEDVNKYYNGRWNIKLGKFMKPYVFGSWRLLLAAAMLMLLTDTCVAMDELVKNPKAHIAFNDILPCVDNPTAQEALNKTKDVTFLLVGGIDMFMTNISPNAGAFSFNQSGPLVPALCNPFHPNKTHKNCADHEVDFIHAATEWRNYVCEVSATGICTTVGRPTPIKYEELVGTVNVSYALYHYGPFLVDLEECSFVGETVREISEDHCPALRRHTRWIVMLLAMVSASSMVSTSFWLLHSRHQQKFPNNNLQVSTSSTTLWLMSRFGASDQ